MFRAYKGLSGEKSIFMSDLQKLNDFLGIEIFHAIAGNRERVLCGVLKTDNVKYVRYSTGGMSYFSRVTCKRCLKFALNQFWITPEYYEIRIKRG